MREELNKEIEAYYDDTFSFNYNWIYDIEELELKLLMLVNILRTESLAFCGTLKTMCEWLGISSNSVNNNKIKQAIKKLVDVGYINYVVEGRNHTISITTKGMNDKDCIKIRKKWITAIKNYNRDENNNKIDKSISISWIKILKVFVYIHSNNIKSTTIGKIANDLSMDNETARKALKAICDLRFDHLGYVKEVDREVIINPITKDKFYRNRGTNITMYRTWAKV